MIYNFDEVINRKGTISSKWDDVGNRVGNPDALPMWVADMDFRSPQPVIDAMVRRAESGIYGYPYMIPKFSEVTQGWVKRRHGWAIDTGWVIFAASIIPAIFNAVQAFTEPGDKVILQRPVYYPFSYAIENNGREISNNSMIEANGEYKVDFEDLERRCADPKAKLFLLCNPHNPLCKVYTREELQRIGDICRKHNVIIFADEIHSDFIFTGHKHVPIASISPEIADVTITAIAPSKTFNLAGMRSACLIIPNPKLRQTMSKKFMDNRSALIPTFGLDAYIAAYENGDEYVDQLVPYIEANAAYLDAYLKENMPKIKLTPPQGTYLMWLDCRELGLSNEALDHFFTFEAAVALDKGYWFGDEGSGFMRMNIACPHATLQEALKRIQAEYDKL